MVRLIRSPVAESEEMTTRLSVNKNFITASVNISAWVASDIFSSQDVNLNADHQSHTLHFELLLPPFPPPLLNIFFKLAGDLKGNIGHGCVNGISSVSHIGTAPHSLNNKGMFNQAQVERKGLQIGLTVWTGAGTGVSWPCHYLSWWALGVRCFSTPLWQSGARRNGVLPSPVRPVWLWMMGG